MSEITFVVYHTDLPDNSIETIVKYTPSFNEKEWRSFLPNTDQYIDTFFKSAQKFHPNCRCVILTDQKTPFNLSYKIERMNVDPSRPAYMRLQAQIEFLEKNNDNIFFLDYDMLIQEDLTPLLNQSFDIALTYRDQERPINGGVVIVPKGHAKNALKFLQKVRTIYDQETEEMWQIWGGAQRSLIEAIGLENFHNRNSDNIEVDGVQILLLPADKYNYSTNDDRGMIDYYPNKKILHFKGNRKHEMLHYWKGYLNRG